MIQFAHVNGDNKEVTFKKHLILLISSACCICGVIWGTIYYFVFGFGLTAMLPWLFVLIVGAAILIAHHLRQYKVLVYAQLICITWITALIQWSIGSINQSGMVIAWSFLGPLGALIFLTRKESTLWMSMFISIVIISIVIKPTLIGHELSISDTTRMYFYLMNLGTAMVIVFVVAAWFVSNIQFEKDRSDALLLNILPANVAEELKRNGKVEPKYFENLTVLFTDFKDFTKLAASLSAKELVSEIDHCFGAFDEITSRFNVEKIKTIGDAYMAVGGQMNGFNCEPCHVLMAGIEMQQFMIQRKREKVKEGKQFFEMRIGIHTGPVVVGVVGVKKFQYDIWGDTVNIANRIESAGEIGRVNISEATYLQVKQRSEFKFTSRGKIEAKGKGKLEMYFAESVLKENESN